MRLKLYIDTRNSSNFCKMAGIFFSIYNWLEFTKQAPGESLASGHPISVAADANSTFDAAPKNTNTISTMCGVLIKGRSVIYIIANRVH